MTTVPWIQAMDQAGAGYEPLPDGVYDVKVISADGAKLTGNGKPMIVAKFQVLTGPHANRTFPNNFVVSLENPNAMSFFFQHMAIFGLDRNYFSQNPSTEHVAQAIVGRTCQVKTSTRPWNGRKLTNVDEILPSSGMQVLGTAPVTTGPTLAPVIPMPGQMMPQPPQPQYAPQPQQPMPQQPAAFTQPPAAAPQPAYQPPPQEQPYPPQPAPQPQYQQPQPFTAPQQPDPGFAQAAAMQPVQAPQMPVAPQQPQSQVPQPAQAQVPAQVPQQPVAPPQPQPQQFDANGQPISPTPQPLTAPPTVPF